jgi:uncharacterized protein YodC (DUF2158 family)
MVEEDFKRGDTVQLKSGGPKMTINDIGEYDYQDFQSALCDWFIQDKAPWKKEKGTFPLHSLRHVRA